MTCVHDHQVEQFVLLFYQCTENVEMHIDTNKKIGQSLKLKQAVIFFLANRLQTSYIETRKNASLGSEGVY